MNAEFLEQKIVLTVVDGETVITPAKVRKGLDPKAFVGAMVCNPGVFSALVVAASKDPLTGKINLLFSNAGVGETIQYDPATGEFAMVPANNEPGGH